MAAAGRLLARVGARCMVALLVFTYLIVFCLWYWTQVLDDAPRPLVLDNSALQREQVTLTSWDNNANISSSPRMKVSMRFVKPLDDNTTSLPPSQERAPAFIIIGSQKGGTRALNAYLWEHSLIELPTEYDEPHFFDLWRDETKSHAENLNTYIETYFDRDCRRSHCLAGESTPVYLYYTPLIPSLLKQTCPWVKFIVLLRDPVKRAQSHHNMLYEEEILDVTFEEHLEHDFKWMNMVGLLTNKTLSPREEEIAWIKYLKHPTWEQLMLGRGLYEIQLRLWFQYFDQSHFLILKSKDLDVNREETMRRVYKFLGVPYEALDIKEKVHVRNYTATLSSELEKRLYDFYRPYNKRLERLLGPEWKGAFEKEV